MNETTLNGQSADIVSENIQRLKQIFPEVFCEDSIDFEKLQAVLGEYTDDNEERYNFTWWGKGRALRLAQIPSMGTLRPCKEESKNWDTTENLYIEGDNLEVLKLLQKSYHGKIKMIYIDPPYNTGKDFVYPDDYRDPIQNYLEMTGQVDEEGRKLSTNNEASGRYHTNWLNMMYPRLRLARNILMDQGIIFISIDDNELDNLKKLCNEVFGEENFIAVLPTVMNLKGNNDQFGFAGTHEYTVVYSKCYNSIEFGYLPVDLSQDTDWKEDDFGYYKKGANLKATGVNSPREKRPNLYFPIYITKENEIQFERTSPQDIEMFPITDGKEMSWRWSQTKFQNEPHNLIVERNGNSIAIYKKTRPIDGETPGTKPKSLFYKPEYSSGNGTNEIKDLFEEKVFSNPKPTSLLSDFIHVGVYPQKNNAIILDFFSGASTTAHSIMKINSEDGGQRKFIMVQLPEPTDENSEAFKAGYKNICEIGKERIRRAGEKIKAELRENQKEQPSILEEDSPVNPDDLDIGFKVLKLDSSNLKKWNPDYENIEESLLDSIENYVDGRSELDVVYEIMLKYGIDLTLPLEEYEVGGKKIYSIGYGALMICLDREITTDVANEIVRLKEDLKPEVMRVVFKDNGFKDDSAKTNTKEILRNAGIEEIVSV